jgi:hypothetical protein
VAREDGLAAGVRTRFSSTNQPKKRGRKPSIFKKWAKENDISEKDIKSLMLNLTFAYTVGEVKELIKQAEEGEKAGNADKLPLGIAQFLAGSVRDINRGDLKAWWNMLDRAYGKPEKTVNHEIGNMRLEIVEELKRIGQPQNAPPAGDGHETPDGD